MDSRLWEYYPIIMPLKQGQGPVPYEDCDEVIFEVWKGDLTESYGPFEFLPDAINKAMELNNQ